ncbi:MAG: hypothetical protein M3Z24_14205, partial [Chloroflexota bacterium]|nr:hypothetical protein [Chloroflexota bacterium]
IHSSLQGKRGTLHTVVQGNFPEHNSENGQPGRYNCPGLARDLLSSLSEPGDFFMAITRTDCANLWSLVVVSRHASSDRTLPLAESETQVVVRGE